jgi:hypothetical protein
MACDPCIKSPLICPDKLGCLTGSKCPDFEISRHDTKPSLSVKVEDCDGPIDLTDVVVEVSMWAKAKLKKAITPDDTYFALADGIGFDQSLVGDIILMDRVRGPEQMLIIGHDENNHLIQVQRGYNGSSIGNYPRGSGLKIFRVLNSFGETQMVEEEIEQIDGTTTTELTESRAIYNWQPNDTCVPGCYYVEFKLVKMVTSSFWLSAFPISFTSVTPSLAGCELGAGVEWIRRLGEIFVKINDAPNIVL